LTFWNSTVPTFLLRDRLGRLVDRGCCRGPLWIRPRWPLPAGNQVTNAIAIITETGSASTYCMNASRCRSESADLSDELAANQSTGHRPK